MNRIALIFLIALQWNCTSNKKLINQDSKCPCYLVEDENEVYKDTNSFFLTNYDTFLKSKNELEILYVRHDLNLSDTSEITKISLEAEKLIGEQVGYINSPITFNEAEKAFLMQYASKKVEKSSFLQLCKSPSYSSTIYRIFVRLRGDVVFTFTASYDSPLKMNENCKVLIGEDNFKLIKLSIKKSF